jgi:hypothetical protein
LRIHRVEKPITSMVQRIEPHALTIVGDGNSVHEFLPITILRLFQLEEDAVSPRLDRVVDNLRTMFGANLPWRPRMPKPFRRSSIIARMRATPHRNSSA